jgi:hypothetical protein
VDERRREQEVGTEPGVELAELTADRRDADRVLEQSAGIDVVEVGRRRESSEPPPGLAVEHRVDRRAQAGVRDLPADEVEEALELVRVAAERRRERRRVGVRLLDRPDVELQRVAELLDPAEHADGVALGEAAVEQLHVVPDAALDASRRIDELEREVVGAGPRPQAPLPRDRVDALHDPILCELRDRAHGRILGP